jgi:hypothetical protein
MPWSPAQIVALALGILMTALGGVALAKGGLGGSGFGSHVIVLGFHHTGLMGLIELVLGVMLLGAAAVPGAGRGLMLFYGVAALAFGIVVAAEPPSFHRVLGTHTGNGWLFIVTGAISLAAAAIAPIFWEDDVTSSESRQVYSEVE